MVEQRIVAFALGQPGLGRSGSRARSRDPEWSGLSSSAQRRLQTLGRHGLNRRAAPGVGRRATARRDEPPRDSRPEPPSTRAGRASWSASTASSSVDCTSPPGRSGRSPRSTRIELRLGRPGRQPRPTGADRPADLPRSRAASLRELAGGLAPRRVLIENGSEFRPPRARRRACPPRRPRHPDPLRPPADTGSVAATDLADRVLANRRTWDSRARSRVVPAHQHATCASSCSICDHFSAFNDEHGHPAGDRQIAASAVAWHAYLRQGDVWHGSARGVRCAPGGLHAAGHRRGHRAPSRRDARSPDLLGGLGRRGGESLRPMAESHAAITRSKRARTPSSTTSRLDRAGEERAPASLAKSNSGSG